MRMVRRVEAGLASCGRPGDVRTVEDRTGGLGELRIGMPGFAVGRFGWCGAVRRVVAGLFWRRRVGNPRVAETRPVLAG